jgi:molybdate transport system substrate-binding protein
MAMRHVLVECCRVYRDATGERVDVACVGGVEAAQRVRRGEPFEFVVLAREAIDALAAERHLRAETRTDLARSAIAIAVARGARRPDIASGSAVRDAVLGARAVGYSTGPSGTHVLRLFEQWAIADAIAPRLVQAPPGVPVAALIARGDVELGFQQWSELMHEPQIDIVGPLPAEIQSTTIFAAAVATVAAHVESTMALLAFLASPACDAAKRAHGMAPARS